MSNFRRGFLISGGIFLLLLIMTTAGLATYYRHRFYPGTSIGSLNLSGQTYSSGQVALQHLLDSYSKQTVVVEAPDLTKQLNTATGTYPLLALSSTADQLGISFSSPMLLANSWSLGHQKSIVTWITQVPKHLFTNNQQPLTYSIDPATVSTYVHTTILPKLVTPVPPMVMVTTGSMVEITKSSPGLQLDETGLTTRLSSALTTLSDGDTLYVQAPTKLVEPTITDAMVQPLAQQLDVLGNLKLTLTASSLHLTPTRAQLLAWFQTVEDTNGTLSLVLNQSAVTSYLTAANTSINPVASTQAVSTALAPLIASVPTKLTIALVLNKSTVQPIAGQFTLGREPGKYLEVDLRSQRLYRITGTNLEKTYIISSGKASTPTPTGQFTVNGHAKMAFSHLYGLYMPFWMNFKDGLYGLHELPVWPNGYREGENHLGIPVSDGCIRLGIGEAEELYNWTPDGTQLFIH